MASFLYYVPCDPDSIDKNKAYEFVDGKGIGYAFEAPPTTCGVRKGPDGNDGMVFTKHDHPRPGYYVDAQTWEQMPESEVWIGFDKSSRPCPQDLARIKMIRGYPVKMPDDNEWIVPIARAANGTCPLPSKAQWNGKMWSRGETLAQYKELFGDACRIMDEVIEQGGGELTFDGEASITVRALAINYCIGPCELSMLNMITEESIFNVLQMIIDWPALAELKKKMGVEQPS